MTASTVSGPPTQVLRLAAISSTAIAAVVLVASLALGWFPVGIALVAGLVVGAGNGYVINSFYGTDLPFGVTSMLRLVILSALVLGAVIVMGPAHVWPVVLGVGLAQLVLAGSAAYIATVRR